MDFFWASHVSRPDYGFHHFFFGSEERNHFSWELTQNASSTRQICWTILTKRAAMNKIRTHKHPMINIHHNDWEF